LLLSGALLAALAAALPASANPHHGGGHRARVGVFIGVPLAAPFYYPPAYYYGPSYYYPPPLAVAPAAPTYYMQQDSSQPPDGYWYYCRDPQGYYPRIQQCPTPWQQVPAQP
jgi:hypothetical protein